MAGTARPERPDPVDLVVGIAFTIALQVEVWVPGLVAGDSQLQQQPALSALSLCVSLPLIARRTAPWPAALVPLAAEAVMGLMETPPDGLANLAAMLLVAYSLGRHAPRPTGYAGILPVIACALFLGEDAADKSFAGIVMGGAWAAGVLVGRRSDDVRGLETARRRSEEARLLALREGAEEERRRIAAELHDVIAHRVSMIVVQSQAADALLENDPAGARRAVLSVEEAARLALTELRQVVGMLSDGAGPDPELLDLSRLGQLVESACEAGVPARFESSGTSRPVAPAVALAAYRIVQESLSNVVRHADGATTCVRLHYGEGCIEVAVDNDGALIEQPAPGHGLSGMQTRAAFVGGTLAAGPRATGGFSVRAVLPTAGPGS